MKDGRKGRAVRLFFAFSTVALLLAAAVIPALNVSAAERLTNDGKSRGDYVSPLIDEHNSYAWCGEVFEQDDGDYLWIGTNRDVIGMAMINFGVTDPRYFDMVGIPYPDIDITGKIFRINLNDPNAVWEPMWQDSAFMGYRKMVVFDGNLYVFAGVTAVGSWTDPNYASVYRFTPDFKPGDTPDVVLWDTLPIAVPPQDRGQFYRAATVFDNKLYVGTYTGGIYCTDGTGLASLSPNNAGTGAKSTGWDLVMDMNTQPDYNPLAGNLIWDMVGFAGSLYVSVSGMNDGFRLFKLTDTGVITVDQVVGVWAPKYGPGMGIKNHVLASPFLATFGGEEYMYLATFANAAGVLIGSLYGVVSLDKLCAAAVYRVNTAGVWEVVVGDKWGPNVAKDKASKDIPHVGNMRAGFYPGTTVADNHSMNQYVWWMAQDADGRLWASTYDMGFMRDLVPYTVQWAFVNYIGLSATLDLKDALADVEEKYSAVRDYLDQVDTAGLWDDIVDVMQKCAVEYRDTMIMGLLVGPAAVTYAMTLISDAIAEIIRLVQTAFSELPTLLTELLISVQELFILAITLGVDLLGAIGAAADAFLELVPLLLSAGSNPAGFDLYYTDDGKNWHPYTVNGLGDADNYGGRVIVPTEKYGTFLLTANPFTGCQVWKLGGEQPDIGIKSGIPDSVSMRVGASVTCRVEYFGPAPDDASLTTSECTAAGISMGPGTVGSMYFSTVTKEFGMKNIYSGLYAYEETPLRSYVYEVTLTGLEAYSGPVEITFNIGDTELTQTVNLNITRGGGDTRSTDSSSTDWLLLLAVAAVVAIVLLAGAFLVKSTKK